jgi:hypothetical protein
MAAISNHEWSIEMAISKLVRIVLVGILCCQFAPPARADLTARFGDPDNPRRIMNVEVSDTGEIRIQQGDDGYFLMLDDQSYFVSAGPGGPEVTTFEALGYLERERVRRGEVIYPNSAATSKQRRPVLFVPGESVTLAGRAGVRYGVPGTDRQGLVLTSDPTLRLLGKAFAAFIQAVPNVDEEENNLSELLADHGVLQFWDVQLTSVDMASIDPSRFALPSKPLTVAELSASEGDTTEPVEGAPKRQPSIIRGAYRAGTLVTLTEDGVLRAWPESAVEGAAIETPGKVTTMCANEGGIVLVTGQQGGKVVELWSGIPGQWQSFGNLQVSDKDPFLALDCGGAEPLAVTGRSLHFVRSGRKVAIDPMTLRPPGYLTTLQHGSYLYIGSNAGEWGGGLRRYPLTGGASEPIDDSDPEDLCGGKLNRECAPVTGLAGDPARPDCVLVSSGLVHMLSSGSVVRVCGRQIETAYAKPFTLNVGWRFDRANPPQSHLSVPFYSLGVGRGEVWAVASDGIYQFGRAPEPVFAPFTRARRFPAGGVDWSHPDFVLVATSMNQRHSLSGASLILVPRN